MIKYQFEVYSIVLIAILIAGLMKLYLYYKTFNISILPFIEPSEIITLFFDNLLYFLCFIGFNAFVIYLFYNNSLKLFEQTDSQLLATKLAERVKSFGYFQLNKIVLFAISGGILFIVYKLLNQIYIHEFVLWVVLLFVGIFLNPFFIFELKVMLLEHKLVLNPFSIIFIITSLNLLVFAALSAINESYKVKNKEFYVKTVVELEGDKIITSNKNYYYIGKTNQFAFFYNCSKNETDIIPMSKIVKLKYVK